MISAESIDVSELQILLNISGEEIRISYPFYDFICAKAKLEKDGYKLEIACKESDFYRETQRFGVAERELPSFSDFRSCLLSSGVIHYNNVDEFKKKNKSLTNLNKSVKYSLDTNMLYHRFISSLGLIEPTDVIMVDTVNHEINAKLNYKYKPETIFEIKKNARFNKHLIEELWNRREKRSRKAVYLASREYKNLIADNAVEIKEVERSSNSQHDNDRIIVETLVKYGQRGRSLPVLLTADDSMADLCNAEELEYFKFDMPYNIEAANCTHRQFSDLLFNLAVVFGSIKINSVVVMGEFRGKSSNRPDELKLDFIDNNIVSGFNKDLTICRKLLSLKI